MRNGLSFLKEYNFKRCYNTYFRIYGENVLQSVGFSHERKYSYPVLDVAFYSLYHRGYCDRWCFTPYGYKAGFPITYCLPDVRLSHCSFDTPKENSIKIFQEYGLSLLDSVYYQKDIYYTTCMFCEKRYGKPNLYTDTSLIEACLYSGLYDEAYMLSEGIIFQNIWAEKSMCEYNGLSIDETNAIVQKSYESNNYFVRIKEMILSKNYNAINELLNINLDNNLKHLKEINII